MRAAAAKCSDLVRQMTTIVERLDPILDFLTDPANDQSINLWVAKQKLRGLQSQVSSHEGFMEKVRKDHQAEMEAKDSAIGQKDDEIARLKKERRDLKREISKLSGQLDFVLAKYPEAGYDLFPPERK